MSNQIQKLRESSKQVRQEVRAKTVGYILTALGLVAGLAWNEAITAFIREVLPLGTNTVWAKFIYAVIITAIVVIVSIYVSRLITKSEEEK